MRLNISAHIARVWFSRPSSFASKTCVFLTTLSIASHSAPIAAQTVNPAHCNLIGGAIDLGPTTITYVVDGPDPIAEPSNNTASAAPKKSFNDWTNGNALSNTCSDGGIVGAVNCLVTEPMESLDAVLTPHVPTGNTEGPQFQTLERNIDPNRDPSDDGLVLLGSGAKSDAPADQATNKNKALAGAQVKVTVPIRRLLVPGNPPVIFSIPAGPPGYESSKGLSSADIKRVENAMASNLEALRKTPPFEVKGPALSQLLQGGSGFSIPVNVRGEDNTLVAAPITNGAALPKACIPLFQTGDKLARVGKTLRDKKVECQRFASQIKTQERINAKGGVLDVVAQFFRADEHLNQLNRRKEICERELKSISRAYNSAKDDHDAEMDRLETEQRTRANDAIKSDPKLLAAEETRRREAAIDTAAAWVKQDEKIQKGMLEYEKNLKSYDDKIALLDASDDPDKAAKIAQLKEDQARYLLAYDSWLERMVAIKHNRWKDHERLFSQNRLDGIGPTNDDELDKIIVDAGGDPEAVIRSRFPDQEFAARDPQDKPGVSQAEKDARSLGGTIGKEASFAELLGEAVKDVATMTDLEKAESIYKYGPSAAKGTGQAVEEGLRGLYDLGKGAVDLNAEFYGFDGFEGSTTDKLSRFGTQIDELGTRGTDDRLNERGYFENFNDNLEKFADAGGGQLERKFENLAGQGERGAKEATRLAAKAGTMIVGGEGAVLQGVARTGQLLRGGAQALDKASEVGRAVDATGDVIRKGNAVNDAVRAPDLVGDTGRAVTSASDDAGTAGRLLGDGADIGTDAGKTTTNPDLGTVSVNKAEQSAQNAALREAYANKPATDPAKTTPLDPNQTLADPLPPGNAPKFRSATPARNAQDALEAAGVDPHLARVFGARASGRDADSAIAAGAFESGVNPTRLYENGSISKDGLRKGLDNYLTEMGVPADRRKAAVDRYMNQTPPPSNSAATAPKPAAVATESGAAQSSSASPDAPVGAGRSAQPPKRGEAGRFSRAELERRLATDNASNPENALSATQRYTPEDVAAAQSARNLDPAATQKLTPEELAGAEAPLAPTPSEAVPAATARMSSESLPSPEAPTVRMTAAEKAAQQAAETQKALTQRYTPEELAAAKTAPASASPSPAATQKLTPEELAGAEAPLAPTSNDAVPAATARMSSESLPSPEAPTVRMTAAEKAAQQATETQKAPTQRYTPEELAAANSARATASPSPAATQKLTPEELAGAKAPLNSTSSGMRSAANPNAPVQPTTAAAVVPIVGVSEDATKRLSPEEIAAALDGGNKPAIVPTEAQPVKITPDQNGDYLFEHAGRQVAVPKDTQIGQGATSTVFGADNKPTALKVTEWDPTAHHLDDLGRERMTGVVPIPELHKRYNIVPGSKLNGDVGLSGGRLSVVERGPQSFSETATALEKAGHGLSTDQKAALNGFLRPLNKEGVVVLDLKSDNFGFRSSINPKSENVLELIPLDDGGLVVLKPEFAHLAPEMQRHILDPGDMLRNGRQDFGRAQLRERLADFDRYVDWDAMNGNLPDRPLRTLGNDPTHGVPYTPNLGLRFSGLAD